MEPVLLHRKLGNFSASFIISFGKHVRRAGGVNFKKIFFFDKTLSIGLRDVDYLARSRVADNGGFF